MPQQRATEPEVRATLELLAGRRTKQIQCEVNSRPLARDVVLQVRVHALVPEIDLGRKRDRKDVHVEVGQFEQCTQSVGLLSCRLVVGRIVCLCEKRLAEGALQQSIHGTVYAQPPVALLLERLSE